MDNIQRNLSLILYIVRIIVFIKKQIMLVIALPITTASIPSGTVISIVMIDKGSFDRSNFKNKSERPLAIKIFMLIELTGVTTLARQSHRRYGTMGNHFSVKNTITNGSANAAKIAIIGNTKKAVILISLRYTLNKCSLFSLMEANIG